MIQSDSFYGSVAAAAAAVIWGLFYLIAQVVITEIPILSVLALMYFLAAVPFLLILLAKKTTLNREIFVRGGALGVLLFAAEQLQFTGISQTSVASSALLGQAIIIFTPVLLVILGKTVSWRDFLRSLVAVTGAYLFTVKATIQPISPGDLYILASAFVFSFYFIVNDVCVSKSNIIHLLTIQFLTTGMLAGVFALYTDGLRLPGTPREWLPIVYLGLIACALAWGLNAYAQKRVAPQKVVIIYLLEPLVAGLLGYLFFSEQPTARELMGAGVILFAVAMPALWRKTY